MFGALSQQFSGLNEVMTTGFAALIQGISRMQQPSVVNTHTTPRSIRQTRKKVWTGPVRRPAEHNTHKVDKSSPWYIPEELTDMSSALSENTFFAF